MGFKKALVAVKVIKDRIQYRSQSLLNLARGYFGSKRILGTSPGERSRIFWIQNVATQRRMVDSSKTTCFPLIRKWQLAENLFLHVPQIKCMLP